jgi:hypothetical protein
MTTMSSTIVSGSTLLRDAADGIDSTDQFLYSLHGRWLGEKEINKKGRSIVMHRPLLLPWLPNTDNTVARSTKRWHPPRYHEMDYQYRALGITYSLPNPPQHIRLHANALSKIFHLHVCV